MRRIFVLLLLLCMLSGCTYYAPPGENHASRVITRIEVTALQGDSLRHYTYTDTQKMANIMDYLRQLEPDLTTTITPDTFRTDAYRITLRLSDGESTVYHQIYDAYLQKDGGPWRSINAARGSALPDLLAQLPSDDP